MFQGAFTIKLDGEVVKSFEVTITTHMQQQQDNILEILKEYSRVKINSGQTDDDSDNGVEIFM